MNSPIMKPCEWGRFMERVDIDVLYRSFCTELDARYVATAIDLPYHLRLTPTPGVPWSEVFTFELTLQAPLFFTDALPRVDRHIRRQAVYAHMLAVIEAFGTDRIVDGQASDDPLLSEVLAQMRVMRDGAIFDVGGVEAVMEVRAADEMTARALVDERRLLDAGVCVTRETYLDISTRKQALGLPASIALGRHTGLGERELAWIREALIGVAVGLQCEDDAIDWEEDASKGGAWAVLLGGATGVQANHIDRRGLFDSGALSRLFAHAADAYDRACLAARHLGALSLAAFLFERSVAARERAAQEARSAGYVGRQRKLAPWLRALVTQSR